MKIIEDRPQETQQRDHGTNVKQYENRRSVYIYKKMTNHKVAIITGGSSGIGRATAVALAKDGVKVAVAACRAKEGNEIVHLVKEAGSDGIFVKTVYLAS